MFARILKFISDLSYLAPIAMYQFRKNYPNEIIHAYGATKAHRHDAEEAISGAGWAFSRRGVAILSDKRLICGDWEIQLDKVKYAEAVLFGSAIVLKVADSSGSHYQFGLQQDPSWLNQDVLSIKTSDEPVKYSRYAKFMRVVSYIGLAIWIASHFTDMF